MAIKKAEMSGYKLPSGLIADNDGVFGKWMEHDFLRYFDIVVLCYAPIKNGPFAIRNILTDTVRTKESTVKHRLKSSS